MRNIYGKYIVTVAYIWVPCFVLFAIIHMFILRPQNKNRVSLERKVNETKQLCEAAETATQEKTRAELNRQLENLKEKLKDYVVDEKDYADLTFAISKIANEKNISGFNIRTEDNRQSSGNPGFSHIYEKHMSVDFASGFNQFAGFLNALERHQPVVFVNDFGMTRSADNPMGHRFNMNLVVLVRKGSE